MNDNADTTQNLVVTRTFDAPLEAVWQAWADGEQVKKWWGPTGFTAPSVKMDFREGGTSILCMSAPGFGEMYNTWKYTKIVPTQSIEFLQSLSDEAGNKIDPTTKGLPADFPQDVRNIVVFKAVGDNKTELMVTEFGYASPQIMEMSRQGLEQCLDKMAASLQK